MASSYADEDRNQLITQKLFEWQEEHHDLTDEEIADRVNSEYAKYLEARGDAYKQHERLATSLDSIEKDCAKLAFVKDFSQFNHLPQNYFFDLSQLDAEKVDTMRDLHMQREKGVGKWWRSEVDKLTSDFAFNLPGHDETVPATLSLADLIGLSNRSWASFINKPAADPTQQKFRDKFVGLARDEQKSAIPDHQLELTPADVQAPDGHETGTVFGKDGLTARDEADLKTQRKAERKRDREAYQAQLEREQHLATVDSSDAGDSSEDTVDELMGEFRVEQQEEKYQRKLAKASEGLNEQQIATFRAGFEAYDEDESGSIDAMELKNCMTKLGQTPTDHELQEYMKTYDADKSGTIDFAEFLHVMGLQQRVAAKQQARMTAASQDLTDAQITSIKASFRRHDTNGDGTVSTKELQQMMTDLGMEPTLGDLMALVRDNDLDGDGLLDLSEFMLLTGQSMRAANLKKKDMEAAKAFLSKEELLRYRQAFDVYDKDGDGTISRDEVYVTMTALGQFPNRAELDAIMLDMDKDQDGVVDFDEFLGVMGRQLREANKRLIEASENLTAVQVEQLKQGFLAYDSDQSGSVTLEELGTALRKMGRSHSLAELKSIMKSFGITNTETGTIDLPAFLNVMGKPLKEANLAKQAYEVVSQDLKSAELAVFLKAFAKFQTSTGGAVRTIHQKDLSKCLKELSLLSALENDGSTGVPTLVVDFKLPKNVSQMKKVLESFDTDKKTGLITFTAFLKVVAAVTKQNNQGIRLEREAKAAAEADLTPHQLTQLRASFNRFDLDKSGTVNARELMLAFRKLGLNLDPAALKSMLAEYDEDNSGSVSYNEFLNMAGKACKTDNKLRTRLRDSLHGLDSKQKRLLLDTFEQHVEASSTSTGNSSHHDSKHFSLSTKQLSTVTRVLGVKTTVGEFKRLVAAVDPEQTGRIGLIPFVEAFSANLRTINTAKSLLSRKEAAEIKKAFAQFDTQGAGTVDQKVIPALLRAVKLPVVSAAEHAQLLKLMTDSEFARVEYASFLTVVSKVKSEFSKKLQAATEGLTSEQVRQCTADFQSFDKNGDQFISLAELSKLLVKSGHRVSAKEMKLIMIKYDTDNNQAIDLAEYLEVARLQFAKKQRLSKNLKGLPKNQIKEMKTAFDEYDKNGDGSIDARELRNVLQKMGQDHDMQKVMQMLNRMDTDNSGTVDFFEFVAEMGKNLRAENAKLLGNKHSGQTGDGDESDAEEEDLFARLENATESQADVLTAQAERLYVRVYGKAPMLQALPDDDDDDALLEPARRKQGKKSSRKSTVSGAASLLRKASANLSVEAESYGSDDFDDFDFDEAPPVKNKKTKKKKKKKKKTPKKSKIRTPRVSGGLRSIKEKSSSDLDLDSSSDEASNAVNNLLSTVSTSLGKKNNSKLNKRPASSANKISFATRSKTLGLGDESADLSLSDFSSDSAKSVVKAKPAKSTAGELMRAVTNASVDQAEADLCDNCETEPIAEHCVDCDMDFCKTCGEDFHGGKKTRTHIRTRKGKAVSKAVANKNKKSSSASKALIGLMAAEQNTAKQANKKRTARSKTTKLTSKKAEPSLDLVDLLGKNDDSSSGSEGIDDFNMF